jgi:predicted metal-dependent enzyme (double-stranded beta helix superfamily)
MAGDTWIAWRDTLLPSATHIRPGSVVVNPLDQSPVVDALLKQIDAALGVPDAQHICHHVKHAMEKTLAQQHGFLPERFMQPVQYGYARHLLHRDPLGRYSIVMMVWDTDQGTPIHDHDGHWCVECVYQGKIEVVSYDLAEERGDDHVRFAERNRLIANIGGAGALIPPHEYHTIHNPFAETAVTMHVYEGEIESCHVFEPTGDSGLYRRRRHELSYN